MRQVVTEPRCQPFFLPANPGERFCIYYPPSTAACHGNIVHVHAFGEEMNKARRMVALQALAFSEIGFGVLLIDLYGCGDSSGDFSGARWEIWKDDIANAVSWLKRRTDVPIGLWGLRLGALLMMDYAKESNESFEPILMWQPVLNGESYLTQFLRLRVASDMLAGGKAKTGTRELKEELKAGHPLEIAGYKLAPELARALDERRLVDFAVAGSTCYWLEVIAEEGGSVSPASRRVIDEWVGLGLEVETHAVAGEPFWATQEITECRPLVSATRHIFSRGPE